jgi:SAM-dependent methyltransferase
MNDSDIRNLIHEVRQKLPKALWTDIPEYIEKDILHIRLAYVPNGRVIDLGGGYSPTTAVLAKLGMDVTVVDTFASTKFYEQFSAEELCEILHGFGVKIVKQDLLQYDPTAVFPPDSVDRVVSHDTLYFFNPKTLLERCLAVMKKDGMLATNVNNAVSFLRRIRVLMGRTNTDSFDSYFFDNVHKRYWTQGDLMRLADFLHLRDVEVIGRNWSLYQSRKGTSRSLLRTADQALRNKPSLCNDIYLIGKK